MMELMPVETQAVREISVTEMGRMVDACGRRRYDLAPGKGQKEVALEIQQDNTIVFDPEGPDPLGIRGCEIVIPEDPTDLGFAFGGQPVLLNQSRDAPLPVVGFSVPGGPSFNVFGIDPEALKNGALASVPDSYRGREDLARLLAEHSISAAASLSRDAGARKQSESRPSHVASGLEASPILAGGADMSGHEVFARARTAEIQPASSHHYHEKYVLGGNLHRDPMGRSPTPNPQPEPSDPAITWPKPEATPPVNASRHEIHRDPSHTPETSKKHDRAYRKHISRSNRHHDEEPEFVFRSNSAGMTMHETDLELKKLRAQRKKLMQQQQWLLSQRLHSNPHFDSNEGGRVAREDYSEMLSRATRQNRRRNNAGAVCGIEMPSVANMASAALQATTEWFTGHSATTTGVKNKSASPATSGTGRPKGKGSHPYPCVPTKITRDEKNKPCIVLIPEGIPESPRGSGLHSHHQQHRGDTTLTRDNSGGGGGDITMIRSRAGSPISAVPRAHPSQIFMTNPSQIPSMRKPSSMATNSHDPSALRPIPRTKSKNNTNVEGMTNDSRKKNSTNAALAPPASTAQVQVDLQMRPISPPTGHTPPTGHMANRAPLPEMKRSIMALAEPRMKLPPHTDPSHGVVGSQMVRPAACVNEKPSPSNFVDENSSHPTEISPGKNELVVIPPLGDTARNIDMIPLSIPAGSSSYGTVPTRIEPTKIFHPQIKSVDNAGKAQLILEAMPQDLLERHETSRQRVGNSPPQTPKASEPLRPTTPNLTTGQTMSLTDQLAFAESIPRTMTEAESRTNQILQEASRKGDTVLHFQDATIGPTNMSSGMGKTYEIGVADEGLAISDPENYRAQQEAYRAHLLIHQTSPEEQERELLQAGLTVVNEDGQTKLMRLSKPEPSRFFTIHNGSGDEREVELITICQQPRIQLLRNFCSTEELDELNLLLEGVASLPNQPNNLLANPGVSDKERLVMLKILKRMAALTDLSIDNFAGLCPSVIRQSALEATKEYATIVRLYLDSGHEGYSSDFPHLGVSLTPKAGAVLRWDCKTAKGFKTARAAHREIVGEGQSRRILTAYVRNPATEAP